MAERSPTPAQRRDAEGLHVGVSEEEPEVDSHGDDQEQGGLPNPATFQNNRASRIPNVKIPFFKGGAHLDPGEYKEWRREIAAIKHSYKLEDKDFAGLVFLATKGDARERKAAPLV